MSKRKKKNKKKLPIEQLIEAYRKLRKVWGFNPKTRVKPNHKPRKSRSQVKRELRKKYA